MPTTFNQEKVLVTGGTGFIGSHLVAELKSQGAHVISVGRITPAEIDKLFSSEQKISTIFHLAGQKSAQLAQERPVETLTEGTEITTHLLEAARTQTHFKKIVLISSLAVYADSGTHHALIETDPVIADSVYASTKLVTEHLGLSYFKDFGVPVTVARFSNVYGPNQPPLAIIPNLIEQMRAQKDLSVGNTQSVRDYIYVKDIVSALIQMALSDQTSGKILNVGTGTGTTVQELIDSLSTLLNFRGKITVDPNKVRAGEKNFVVADISAIKALTGWAPRTPLMAGLKEMLK